MSDAYQLSMHAIQRIEQRRLRPEWLVAALDGKQARQNDGTVIFCDPESRWVCQVECVNGCLC